MKFIFVYAIIIVSVFTSFDSVLANDTNNKALVYECEPALFVKARYVGNEFLFRTEKPVIVEIKPELGYGISDFKIYVGDLEDYIKFDVTIVKDKVLVQNLDRHIKDYNLPSHSENISGIDLLDNEAMIILREDYSKEKGNGPNALKNNEKYRGDTILVAAVGSEERLFLQHRYLSRDYSRYLYNSPGNPIDYNHHHIRIKCVKKAK